MAKRKGKPPVSNSATVATTTTAPRTGSSNAEHPKFCLAFIQSAFDVKALPEDQQADFAKTLQDRASLSWEMIMKAERHGQGYEHLPSSKLPSPPAAFSDRDQFMVFRYSGKRPMVGVRVDDVFHIIWIEREFGELYSH